MKKMIYTALAAMVLLCGCSQNIFPIRGVKKAVETQAPQVENKAVALQDTVVAEAVQAEEPVVEREPIPEEWTTIKDDSLVVIESMSGELDSLLNSWYAQTYLMVDTTCTATATNPIFSDTVYTERLANLPCLVQMVYNQPVRSSIDRYATKLRHQVSYMLGMMQYYEPIIEQALDVHGVPNELKYLPVIESALNPVAVSRAGATGLWQFMYSTGKLYGLKQNSLVDDRRDPVKATWAAAKHLRDLYDRFGDWSLAIAAYNCGSGNVNKAIYRSGGKTNFWDIYYYLPRETRGYVPAFIAATYAFNYHREHNIAMTKTPIPLALDTIHVNRITHLEQISSTIDVDIETLRLLNPQYRMDIIPASTKPYTLVLPQRNVNQYIEREQEIMAKDSTYLKEYLNPVNLDKKRLEKRTTYHRIKRGETLGGIARRYGVTVNQLMRWNGIRNAGRIREGQRIRIEK